MKDNLENLKFDNIKAESKKCPVFLKGKFKAGDGECFVNMKGFTKGYVFVNGFNLGRYWNIGPQTALYLPGALLKEENEIIVFEMEKEQEDYCFEFKLGTVFESERYILSFEKVNKKERGFSALYPT